jgi:anti-sigma factor RsiW
VSHLGERLTALVDGELEHDERDRAYAHLAACAACRAEAEALRRLKSELRSLDEAAPPSDFLARLSAMNGEPRDLELEPAGRDRRSLLPGGTRPYRGRGPLDTARGPADREIGRGWMVGQRRPTGTRPRGGGRPRRGRSTSRGRYLAVGAVTLAVLGAGAVSVAATATPDQLPQVAPALERFAVEHVLMNNTAAVPAPATTPVADRHTRP